MSHSSIVRLLWTVPWLQSGTAYEPKVQGRPSRKALYRASNTWIPNYVFDVHSTLLQNPSQRWFLQSRVVHFRFIYGSFLDDQRNEPVRFKLGSFLSMRNEPNLKCPEAVQIRFILEAVSVLTSLNPFKTCTFVQDLTFGSDIVRKGCMIQRSTYWTHWNEPN